jgi:hypothetical protein
VLWIGIVPDQNFHFDADPELAPNWSLTHVGKSETSLIFFTILPVFIAYFFISVIGVPIFSILDSIESFCKEVSLYLPLVEINTDLDR